MKPLDPRLLRYARGSRQFLVATVALGVAQAGLIVAQAALLAHGIAAVFLDGVGLSGLRWSLLSLALVILGRAAVGWAQEACAVRASAAVKSELRGRLLAHVAALGPGHASAGELTATSGGGPSDASTGAVIALVTRGLDSLDAYFARYLPQLVLAALIPAVVLARLLPADLIATCTIALTLPLIPVFMALVGMHTEAANRRQFKLLARLSHHFLDVVAGLATLKVFNRAGAQAANIRRVSTEQRRITMRTLRIAFLSSLVLELLATLSVALVAVGIGLRLVSGHLDLATALLVLILAPEAYLPLRQVGVHYHASAEGLAAAEEAFSVLESPLPPSGSKVAFGDIAFEDVVVRYRNQDALRLNGRIRLGEIVALTGPSGCGKSTALNVLLGFATPSSGRVTIGGTDLTTLDMATWRSRIGWVPQRPHLFAGTVRDNITLGTTGSDSEVTEAARLAGLAPRRPGPTLPGGLPVDHYPLDGHDRAGGLWTEPDCGQACAGAEIGLGRVLGDDGAGVSAGQRQRIALARAFLRRAPIVLLDEPTANLDAETADGVMDSIRELARGRTVLIAAHRPELIALADRVIDLSPVGVR